MKQLQLLKLLIKYLRENGRTSDFLEWAELYDHDKDEIEDSIDNFS